MKKAIKRIKKANKKLQKIAKNKLLKQFTKEIITLAESFTYPKPNSFLSRPAPIIYVPIDVPYRYEGDDPYNSGTEYMERSLKKGLKYFLRVFKTLKTKDEGLYNALNLDDSKEVIKNYCEGLLKQIRVGDIPTLKEDEEENGELLDNERYG